MFKRDRGAISIKWRMLLYIGAFTVLMLVFVWVFQVLLLDRFYESTKLAELDSAADEMVENIDDKEVLENLAIQYATDYQMYVRVVEIKKGTGLQIVSAQPFGNYYIRNADDQAILRLYQLAVADRAGIYSGGFYRSENCVLKQILRRLYCWVYPAGSILQKKKLEGD